MATVRDAMTESPRTVDAATTVTEVATQMRDADVGAILVTESDTLSGIVTDRDIVVRAVAEGRDPDESRAGDVCTSDPHTLSPDEDLGDAVRRVKSENIRRLPVVEDGKPVGILSLGDLAEKLDPESVLADISAAPANN
jgi:signal-transduction protein with cAMP-binding, CBS, and nucleotidyltransferase domain